jgi:GT2 family glycosyltransferase
MQISIIIVSWNVRDLLLDCIRSVREQMQLDQHEWEIIVVDNASSDGSVEALQGRETGVRLIANRENVGFGRANNQGYRAAKGRTILLLNPDTVVLDHAIDRLLRKLDTQPRVGVLGCRLLNADLSFQRWTGGHLPTLGNLACHFFFLYKLLPSQMLPRPLYLEDDPTEDRRPSWVSGACMLIRREAVEATGCKDGIFDSRFFLYGEDMDFCRRLERAGWEVMYTPAAAVVHLEGRSFQQQSVEVQSSKLRGLRNVFAADRSAMAVFLFDFISATGFALRWLVNGIGAIASPSRFAAQAELSRQRLFQTLREPGRRAGS